MFGPKEISRGCAPGSQESIKERENGNCMRCSFHSDPAAHAVGSELVESNKEKEKKNGS